MILVTGTYPPERCGVGDYAAHMLQTPEGRQWTLFHRSSWHWSDLPSYLKALRKTDDRVLNLQYPTMGYSTSLVPHVLAACAVMFMRKRLYITVHEYSQLGWKGKLALNALFLLAKDVVFTTSFELDCAHRHNPWMRKGTVVKIRSNIPVSVCKPMKERKWDVGYFGYIRPLKGIEDFLPVAEQLHRQDRRVYVMGQVQPEFSAFHQPLLAELEKKGIAYFGNLSQEEVADMLADTRIMYLPYPDGLSERRGSFLAAVVNGAAVVSTEGPFTAQEQKERFALTSVKEAYPQISAWLEDARWLERQQQQSLSYAAGCVPTSWEQIVEDYNRIMR